MWADAVYVRDMFELREHSAHQLLAAALVMHEVYHSYDICAHMLAAYDARLPTGGGGDGDGASGGTPVLQRYMSAMGVTDQ
jgi:hypothetical protein